MTRLSAALAAWAFATGFVSAQEIRFEDVAGRAGVHFRYHSGSRGRHDLPEIMGGGLALFDADGDGLPDLYACQGGPISDASPGGDPPGRLYRNLGSFRFEDVTATADAPGPSYAMGAAAGDYDGDGRVDLLVTGWRGQRLYRNLGGFRFADVTSAAGLASDRWTTGAAWADLDGDGDLDLYVAAYLDYDPDAAPYCAAPDGRRDYCAPEDFEAQPDHLYRNDGGVFADVAAEAGLPARPERGLGVLVADFDGDSQPDVFVANDGGRCRLLANRGGLRFEDVAEAAGVARDGRGRALAGMGTATGDLDGDGLPDLVVANFLGRSTIAFRSIDGRGMFQDDTARLGLADATRDVLGFGVAAEDFDADGRVDLLQVNGHVLDRGRLGVPFAMTPTLLRGREGGLVDASAGAGDWFARAALGRGLAVADLDGDGRQDAAASALDAPLALLRNVSPSGPTLSVDLVDRHGLPAIGARVRAVVGGMSVARHLSAGDGYLSSSPPRLTFATGGAAALDALEVRWPRGGVETWRGLLAGRVHRLVEGRAGVSAPDVSANTSARRP